MFENIKNSTLKFVLIFLLAILIIYIAQNNSRDNRILEFELVCTEASNLSAEQMLFEQGWY